MEVNVGNQFTDKEATLSYRDIIPTKTPLRIPLTENVNKQGHFKEKSQSRRDS